MGTKNNKEKINIEEFLPGYNDLPNIQNIVENLFSKSTFKKDIENLLSNKGFKIYFIKDGERVLGFIRIIFIESKSMMISQFYIISILATNELYAIKLFLKKLLNEFEKKYVVIVNLFDGINVFENIDCYDASILMRRLKNEKNNDKIINLPKNHELIHNYSDYEDFQELLCSDRDRIQDTYKDMSKISIETSLKSNIYEKISIAYKINDKLAGFIVGWIEEKEKHIYYLYVNSQYRGLKIGRVLMRKFLEIDRTKSYYLTVYRSNSKALSLYAKLGFKQEKYTTFIFTENLL